MKLLYLLFLTISSAAGYHILCIHTVPSKSHYHMMRAIVDPLLNAGHQVSFMTPFPQKSENKNLKIIDASHLMSLVEGKEIKEGKEFVVNVGKFARDIATKAMDNPGVRDAIVKNNYDAVVTEWFFSELESGYAAIQQVPWIVLCGTMMHSHMEYLVDTVRSVSTVPDLLNFFPIPLNFWQRVVNTFTHVKTTLDFWKGFSSMKLDYERSFGPLAQARGVPLPPFEDAHKNISILLVNSHPSFDPARVLPPNVVYIGGYHIDDNTTRLPKDLQDIMASSPQGVIYFSMGSVLKSSMLEEETKRELLEMFAELPYTVLWKFEDKLDGLPKNVHIRPWMPQTSILAHPNTKIFITHGGLLSTLEGIKYGIPLVTIPVFGDQPGNAQRSVMSGLGLKVDLSDSMVPELKTALKELLTNDSYHKKAKSISAIFNKRAVHTSTLITHYIELAIETRGANHLHSKTKLYAWYEHTMLDLAILILGVVSLLGCAAQRIISSFSNNVNKTKKIQ